MTHEEQSLQSEVAVGVRIAPSKCLVRSSHSVMVRGEYLENSIAAVKTTLVSTDQKKLNKKTAQKDINTNKACFSVNTGGG